MAGLTVAAPALHAPWPDEIVPARALLAARSLWSVDGEGVVLIGGDAAFDAPLRRALMACGLEVYAGGDCPGSDDPAALVVHARSLPLASAAGRVAALRGRFPLAPLCVVSALAAGGDGQSGLPGSLFNDATAIMARAGIAFLVVEGT
jgi:hypothetical protein